MDRTSSVCGKGEGNKHPGLQKSLTEAWIYTQNFDNTIVVGLPTAAQEILRVRLAGTASTSTSTLIASTCGSSPLGHRHSTWSAARWRSVGGAVGAVATTGAVSATTAGSSTKATVR